MRCPFCDHPDTVVKDSRPTAGNVIRRRRECPSCKARVTTFEHAESHVNMVIKRDGRRVAFDRLKLIGSMRVALAKCRFDEDRLERLVDGIALQMTGKGDHSTTYLAEKAVEVLGTTNRAAQLRYASFYPQFQSIIQGHAA